ncbi:MAG: site-specific integrase [Polyangiaceae bacterium]
MTETRDTKPRTGTIVKTKLGQWQPVVTLRDGTRKRLKPFAKGTSEAMAREKTAVYAEQAYRLGLKRPTPKGVPAGGEIWWEAWFAHRDAKGLGPVRPMYNGHIAPLLGDKKPAEWTREDCEKLSRSLDAKVTAERLTWKTATNVWALFTRACKVACSHKSPDVLRVRKDNPCVGVEGPERGDKKQKQWLYPDELSKLVACTKVPLRWRRLYALLTYLYVRPSELKVLEWSDVSFETNTVHINKAWDRNRATLKPPKTSAGVRHVPIEPNLLPLLEALHKESGGVGRVVASMPPDEEWALTLRRHLHRAEITRAELFADTATHKQVTLYDLRATGITWRCLRQDYAPEVQQAAGHEKYDTTDGYIRTARVFIGRVGAPFPPLPMESLHPIDHPIAKSAEPFCSQQVHNPVDGWLTTRSGLPACLWTGCSAPSVQ